MYAFFFFPPSLFLQTLIRNAASCTRERSFCKNKQRRPEKREIRPLKYVTWLTTLPFLNAEWPVLFLVLISILVELNFIAVFSSGSYTLQVRDTVRFEIELLLGKFDEYYRERICFLQMARMNHLVCFRSKRRFHSICDKISYRGLSPLHRLPLWTSFIAHEWNDDSLDIFLSFFSFLNKIFYKIASNTL